MPKSLYFPYMHRMLEQHLTRCVVRVAYPKEWEENGRVYHGNTRHILGFIVADVTDIGLVVHYLYTRRDYGPKSGIEACYRNQGIATELLTSMLEDFEQEDITFTIWGQDLIAFPELALKLEEIEAIYNNCLWYTLMLPEWEKGLPSRTADADMARAIKLTSAYMPTVW